MEKIKHFVRTRPNRTIIILGICFAVLKAMYFLFNKPLPNTFDFSIFIDNWIPFSPVWIIPYETWYLFLPGIILLLYLRDKKACARAMLTQILGVTTCYIMYSIFQTTVARPDVIGSDIFSSMVRHVYSMDNPYNAFPSIHVLGAFTFMLATAKAKGISKPIHYAVWTVGWLIILSTVFVKQHVIVDIFAGLAVARVYFSVSGKILDQVWESEEA